MLKLVEYNRDFLDDSWIWLNDKEIRKLVMVNNLSRSKQQVFFDSIPQKTDYLIFGVEFHDRRIGVAGIKNIKDGAGEYWGFIGDKSLWGKGLGQDIINNLRTVAQKNGLTSLYLKVSLNNKRAIKAYLKAGFKKINLEKNLMVMGMII